MIIESGIDIVQALCGSVSNDDPRGVWVVATDENLRLLYIEPIAAAVVGDIVDHADDVELFLGDQHDVEYFALVWSSDEVRERDSGWLNTLDTRLRERLASSGRRLLGQVVFDPNAMFATVPGCAFSMEPGLADLPRALAIRGPHGLGCGCPICAAERREMEASYDPGADYDDPAFWADGVGAPKRFDQPRLFDEPQYEPSLRRWIPEPERAYKRWTFDEEVDIARSHFAGLSCFDISILVKRQPSAIAARLNKLKISSSTVVLTRSPERRTEAGAEAETEAGPRSDLPPSRSDPARPDR